MPQTLIGVALMKSFIFFCSLAVGLLTVLRDGFLFFLVEKNLFCFLWFAFAGILVVGLKFSLFPVDE